MLNDVDSGNGSIHEFSTESRFQLWVKTLHGCILIEVDRPFGLSIAFGSNEIRLIIGSRIVGTTEGCLVSINKNLLKKYLTCCFINSLASFAWIDVSCGNNESLLVAHRYTGPETKEKIKSHQTSHPLLPPNWDPCARKPCWSWQEPHLHTKKSRWCCCGAVEYSTLSDSMNAGKGYRKRHEKLNHPRCQCRTT